MSHLIDRTASLSRLSVCVFYLLTVTLLLLSNLSSIATATYEASDFATNSVLIQQAKAFDLWTGNYSRVGFHHPGPAILYVLAAGEVVFHDWLHWVQYPFAGQLVAVAFYNALWITLAFTGFYRLTQSKAQALGALAVLLLTLSLLEHSVFNGIWMPYLYVFPFVIAVMAIARLIEGRTDSLQALALSSGFLINGHASFIGILGVLLLASLAGNYLMFRKQPQLERTLLSAAFIARHAKPLGLACLTLFVFFIPLIVMTIKAYPGPLAQYVQFSGGHAANSLTSSALFIAAYWGGAIPAVIGLLLLILAWLLSAKVSEHMRMAVQAQVVALLAGTLAILIYARYGVDFLNEKYLGLFYYAVPALTIAYAALVLFTQTRLANRKAWVAVLAIAILAASLPIIMKPIRYSNYYAISSLPKDFQTLDAARQNNHLAVLDLDNTATNWADVWGTVSGMQAYAMRKGVKAFCVNRNWHILFTTAYRCSEEEVRLGTRLVVTDYNRYPDRTAVLSDMIISVYPPAAPTLSSQDEMTVKGEPQLFDMDLLAAGWSNLEPEQVWSDGKQADLTFKTTPDSAGSVVLDLMAFLPTAESRQRVTFLSNGKPVVQTTFSAQQPRQQVRVPVSASDQVQELRLLIDTPFSPKAAGLSPDTRQLGVALFGLKFEPAAQ